MNSYYPRRGCPIELRDLDGWDLMDEEKERLIKTIKYVEWEEFKNTGMAGWDGGYAEIEIEDIDENYIYCILHYGIERPDRQERYTDTIEISRVTFKPLIEDKERWDIG